MNISSFLPDENWNKDFRSLIKNPALMAGIVATGFIDGPVALIAPIIGYPVLWGYITLYLIKKPVNLPPRS